MTSSESSVPTTVPTRYMEQLCKHFEHKLPVTRAPEGKSITFSIGVCNLKVEDNALIMRATANDEPTLRNLEDVVARHLKRFAFREEPEITWTAAA